MSGVALRTLVVDDSSSVRKLLLELLRERDHEVTTVGTAEEGLEAHLRHPFHLMLVDWTLPGMSGLELCRAVRNRPGGEHVVILVITGRNRAEDLHAVLDAGASDYLSKPIDPEILGTRLLIAERAIAEGHRRAEERQEMESRLAFADRMASIGTLTAGVAHELNNPLMYVLSNLRLTREEIDAQADAEALELARQQLDEAIHGAIRMQNIVRDLKTFSRVDDEQRGKVDVQGVLESSINICWNEIRHRATLERDFGEIPVVDVNESRLGQVFLNLLINAAQAMPERPVTQNRITVRTHTDADGWAVVEVADNGTGIEPDRMSHVFEPFFTTKSISEGTGLGLSICKDIVRDAGGTIEARSEAGRGSTFVVRLPASTRADAPQATQKPPTVTVGSQRDGHRDRRRALGRALDPARASRPRSGGVFERQRGDRTPLFGRALRRRVLRLDDARGQRDGRVPSGFGATSGARFAFRVHDRRRIHAKRPFVPEANAADLPRKAVRASSDP